MAELMRNEPTANVLMNSMRSMGYTFESAIADVIDNSISAKCHEIRLKFPIDPQDCYVAICDDGEGMSKNELFDAMKYGSQLKKDFRELDDLGRFGLGLKSASLSQCRKLTLASKKNGIISSFCWDLNNIEKQCDWSIIEYNESEISNTKFIDYLDNKESGTIVLWENFDILRKSSGSVYAELSKYQESVTNYLELIFHRYLNKSKPNNVDIYVNNYKLEGLDPFLEKHKKTNIRREMVIPVKDSLGAEQKIVVQPYVLPFQKDLSAADKKKSGGIEEYRTKQGFYIYRNERLIIWGTWFGRRRGELTKHARVRVDIPNTLDDIWCIDIKKQTATIPNVIKNQLTKAVDEAMNLAIKAQQYRGRIENVDDNVDYIWNRVKVPHEEQFFYKINRDSKIFNFIKDAVDDETWSRIDMVLDEIENSVPYQQIYIDKSQNKVYDTIDDERIADIKAKAIMLVKMAIQMSGQSKEEAIEKIFVSEPFVKYPQLKDKILEEI